MSGAKNAKALAEAFQAQLSARGFRSTRQRGVVAEAFFHMGGHLSVEEIHDRIRQGTAGVGPATIYRTMKLLVECEMAKARHFGDGRTRYEAYEAGGHHDHLICTTCGTIVEFENETIERLQEEVAERHAFVLSHHRMELYGVCSACA